LYDGILYRLAVHGERVGVLRSFTLTRLRRSGGYVTQGRRAIVFDFLHHSHTIGIASLSRWHVLGG
jgi:hypothetical protein